MLGKYIWLTLMEIDQTEIRHVEMRERNYNENSLLMQVFSSFFFFFLISFIPPHQHRRLPPKSDIKSLLELVVVVAFLYNFSFPFDRAHYAY
jgi:hypothetical protein